MRALGRPWVRLLGHLLHPKRRPFCNQDQTWGLGCASSKPPLAPGWCDVSRAAAQVFRAALDTSRPLAWAGLMYGAGWEFAAPGLTATRGRASVARAATQGARQR